MALQEDTILAAKADEFRNDSPCISGAMKSYLTVLLAEEVTRPPIPVVRHIRDGVDLTPPVAPTMNQKDVMDCARVVLQLVNAYEPPTEAEWAENHPQVPFSTDVLVFVLCGFTAPSPITNQVRFSQSLFDIWWLGRRRDCLCSLGCGRRIPGGEGAGGARAQGSGSIVTTQ